MFIQIYKLNMEGYIIHISKHYFISKKNYFSL